MGKVLDISPASPGTWHHVEPEKNNVLILQCSSEHLSNFCIYGSGVWWTGGCFP